MKKLIALLAVLSFGSFATASGDWTHSGEYRLQYFNEQERDFNKDATDNDQYFQQRVRWNTAVRAGEKMTFNLGLVHNADWGSNGGYDQYPNNIDDRTKGRNTTNLLTVNEAYASWQATDELTLKFGRISQTLGDGTVVSDNDWEPVKKAFDAVGAIYDLEMVRLGAFGVYGSRGFNSANEFQNRIGAFYGIAADWKNLPDFLKMAHLHYILVKRDRALYDLEGTATAIPKEDSSRIGITLAGDKAGFDYRATYAIYQGETTDNTDAKTDIDASMLDLELGYSIPSMMNFRVHGGYHVDSGDKSGGDNERYNGFHYNTHYNAGRMDVLGWGNLTYTRFGVSLTPVEDLTVGAEYFMFEKTEKADSVNAGNGSILNAAVVNAGDDEEIGQELDIVVTKKYSNNFAIQARYGMFTAGKGIKQTSGSDDTRSQWYLETKLTF